MSLVVPRNCTRRHYDLRRFWTKITNVLDGLFTVLLYVSQPDMQHALCTNGFSGRHSLRLFRPLSVKYFGVSRRSSVIGAHSEIYSPGVAACRCWHSWPSCPPAPARGWGRDAAIFSAGISSIYMDDTQRLLHAFSDDPDVNALDGENFPNQVSGHRARRMDPRSTHATWVLHLRVATKKPAVRC